jgi:hypothetical protein
VTGYALGAAKAVGPDEVVYAVDLTTDGSRDGSVPAGRTTWFYELQRTPAGGWRLAGGGSGP